MPMTTTNPFSRAAARQSQIFMGSATPPPAREPDERVDEISRRCQPRSASHHATALSRSCRPILVIHLGIGAFIVNASKTSTMAMIRANREWRCWAGRRDTLESIQPLVVVADRSAGPDAAERSSPHSRSLDLRASRLNTAGSARARQPPLGFSRIASSNADLADGCRGTPLRVIR